MFQGKLHDESTGTEDKEKAKKIAKAKTSCSSALGDVLALTARLEKAKDEQAVLEAKMNPSLNLFRMVDAYISCDIIRRRNSSTETIRCWRALGNKLIDRFGGNTELRKLKREDAEAFMRDFEKHVSPHRFNYTLNFYKSVWRTLRKYDSPTELKARLGEEDPWAYILRVGKGEVVGKKPFTHEQLVRIWRVLEKRNDPELTMLFDLARNTGARLHDLVSWKWEENITFTKDDGKMEAIVKFKPIKTAKTTGRILVIPILDDRVVSNLYAKYSARGAGEEYVMPRIFKMYGHNKGCNLSYMCQKVFREAGLKTREKSATSKHMNCVYGLHSFRHTLVSELFEKGVDLGTIQHLYTGHGSNFMTELYAHAKMEKKRIDLSLLAPIETAQSKVPTWIENPSEADRKAFDSISLLDAPKPVKIYLRGLMQFKRKEELETIRNWLDKRIEDFG